MPSDADVPDLGARVRDARVAAALTQSELAEAATVSRNYIAQVEMGRKKPSIKTLDAIANATRTSTLELLKGDEFISRLSSMVPGEDVKQLVEEIEELLLSL